MVESTFDRYGGEANTMENAQVALKLMLDELDLEPTVETVQERKTVQKAIYLGQVAGVDLGYRYNWYVMGPYSPALTRDYFALGESLSSGDDPSNDYELQEAVKTRLARVKPVIEPPVDVKLRRPEWLELIASVHYLLEARRMSWDRAEEYLCKQKPHVAPYAGQAREALEKHGLIPATV
jgi:hypothetical protein